MPKIKEIAKDYMKVALIMPEDELFGFADAILMRVKEQRGLYKKINGQRIDYSKLRELGLFELPSDAELGLAVRDLKKSARHYCKSEGWAK